VTAGAGSLPRSAKAMTGTLSTFFKNPRRDETSGFRFAGLSIRVQSNGLRGGEAGEERMTRVTVATEGILVGRFAGLKWGI
jgi:hypothetical protein